MDFCVLLYLLRETTTRTDDDEEMRWTMKMTMIIRNLKSVFLHKSVEKKLHNGNVTNKTITANHIKRRKCAKDVTKNKLLYITLYFEK